MWGLFIFIYRYLRLLLFAGLGNLISIGWLVTLLTMVLISQLRNKEDVETAVSH